ncbi:hypothetical protein G4B88_001662 [Cannabis sativa]|uniref:Uncharacterized protein n=1 Tax=Cannabis sativa TaxID=3483 RepID=A0A7J6I387_CANSA|nr:hypothetical protein G4B88_001662 [Cannabis sativa]
MDIALFSPSSLFSEEDDVSSNGEEKEETQQSFVERKHEFSGMELTIREFSFHQLNANLLWPGTFAFVEWLVEHRSWIEGRRCLELGSGTGALAIFLRKLLHLEITTSDYADQEIEDNIAHNCKENGIIPALPHIHGVTVFQLLSRSGTSSSLAISYCYPNLIKTLSFLLNSYKSKDDGVVHQTKKEENGMCIGLPKPAFLMSWRRRIGKEDESLFFSGCKDAGLDVKHIGSRVYCIKVTIMMEKYS